MFILGALSSLQMKLDSPIRVPFPSGSYPVLADTLVSSASVLSFPNCGHAKVALPIIYKAFVSLAAPRTTFHNVCTPWDKARSPFEPPGSKWVPGWGGCTCTLAGSWSESWPPAVTLCSPSQQSWLPPFTPRLKGFCVSAHLTLGLIGKLVVKYCPVTAGLNSQLTSDCLQIASRSAA